MSKYPVEKIIVIDNGSGRAPIASEIPRIYRNKDTTYLVPGAERDRCLELFRRGEQVPVGIWYLDDPRYSYATPVTSPSEIQWDDEVENNAPTSEIMPSYPPHDCSTINPETNPIPSSHNRSRPSSNSRLR